MNRRYGRTNDRFPQEGYNRNLQGMNRGAIDPNRWDYTEGFGNYGNRDYSDGNYYGPNLGGYYPNMLHLISDGSRFERDFDNDESRGRGKERGWWDRTYDEVARWLGDEEAEYRRQMDERRHAMRNNQGKGPKNYKRSDERIEDDVNNLLWANDMIDASDMEVKVENREVTLTGTVESRYEKRLAEDIAESVWGVIDVLNLVRVKPAGLQSSYEYGSDAVIQDSASRTATTNRREKTASA